MLREFGVVTLSNHLPQFVRFRTIIMCGSNCGKQNVTNVMFYKTPKEVRTW